MTNILHDAKMIVHICEAKHYYYHKSDSITNEDFTEKKMELLDASRKVLDLNCKNILN